MSGNEVQGPESPNVDNAHGGEGPFFNQNRFRTRNNNQNPLINVRDRLFHTLFYRAALAYARTFPRPLRRIIEFVILIKAIAAFFVLVYIHIVFSKSPSTCLLHVKNTWPRDGILRVEIVRNLPKDYNIQHSYAKEEKLKQQGKAEDFGHIIGLLARDGFINIEPSAVEDSIRETEPLESVIYNSNDSASSAESNHRTILPDALANVSKVFQTPWNGYDLSTDQPNLLLDSSTQKIDRTETEVSNASEVTKPHVDETKEITTEIGWHENEYIVEFSLEYGFLRLNPATRAKLKIPVEIVFLDPTKDECFGDSFSRLILEEFLGYDDLLLASIKPLAEKEDNKGYLRNVVSGEHYRFVSMWMARTSYFGAFFIMIVFLIPLLVNVQWTKFKNKVLTMKTNQTKWNAKKFISNI